MEMTIREHQALGARSIPSRLMTVGIICLLLPVVTWVVDRSSIDVQLFAYAGSYGFFVNAIPVVVTFLLLLSFFNRVALSLMMTVALMLMLYGINYMKLKYLNVPVSLNDLYVLESVHASTLELLANFLSVAWLVFALLLVVGVIGGSIWLERAFFKPRSATRAALALSALLFMVSLGIGARWVGAVYSAERLRAVGWAPMLTIVRSGVISSIAMASAERKSVLDVPVDQAAIDRFMAMDTGPTRAAATASAERPDIVIIQSESFFDPAILKSVDSTAKELPNLHRALRSGIGGTMEVPTFGGNTVRTEFEVLTGIPIAAYPRVEFPYLQIQRKTMPSLVHLARSDGYSTIAIHGNAGAFWNRDKAFQALGFDTFITAEQFPADSTRDGWFFSDAAMTDQIIGQLDKAETPAMIFAIGIQGHGPYLDVPVADTARRDAITAPPGLVGDPLKSYRNFIYHIENADQQLGRLWDYLEARQRPYVLVFYGDHLPGLQRVFAATGFDNGGAGPQQTVPWFIVGSAVAPHRQHICAWMMGSEILSAAGLAQSPYYLQTSKARDALDRDPGDAEREVILEGIYSLARLRLTEDVADKVASSHETNTGGSATIRQE